MLGILRRVMGVLTLGHWKYGIEDDAPRLGSDESEQIAEVVEITEVLPHPNADRLEILHFRRKGGPTAYTVVDRKGRKAGDLVVYVGVDCIVPIIGPFKFLSERPDGKDKSHFRLRAARFRGVYSEGLIVDLPDAAWGLGKQVADLMAISYHNPEPEGAAGPTQPSKKPRRDWRRNVIPEYGVISLRKAPHHFTPGEPVVVTEKVHGTNARFGLIGSQFVVGSHRTFKTDNRRWWERLLGVGPKVHGPGWYGEDLWMHVALTRALHAECEQFRGWVFYGEIYGTTPGGKKVQDLTYGLRGPALRLFDAWHTGEKRWASWLELRGMAHDMGISVVPVLYVGPYDLEEVQRLAEGQSTLDKGTVREGVVVRALDDPGRRGKWVGEGYRTRKEV